MDKAEEKLKKQIKFHLEFLGGTNMYPIEMDITTTDLYNLFKLYTQQASREQLREAWRAGAAYGNSRSNKNWNDFWQQKQEEDK